jgi:hypothetical protein
MQCYSGEREENSSPEAPEVTRLRQSASDTGRNRFRARDPIGDRGMKEIRQLWTRHKSSTKVKKMMSL